MEIEKKLGERDLIVSSTDKKGIICYVNKTFEDISEYSKDELYGQPHNVIRHPDMPKAVFRYIWNSLSSYKALTRLSLKLFKVVSSCLKCVNCSVSGSNLFRPPLSVPIQRTPDLSSIIEVI